jgi:hypothetical protein
MWCGHAAQRLEGVEEGEWLVFERVMIVRDLFTGGTRTFHNQHDAVEFRSNIYQQYGAAPPQRCGARQQPSATLLDAEMLGPRALRLLLLRSGAWPDLRRVHSSTPPRSAG